MPTDVDLEHRVAVLEHEVAELKRASPPPGANWLRDLMAGAVRDEEGMRLLAEIVRANREAGVFDGSDSGR